MRISDWSSDGALPISRGRFRGLRRGYFGGTVEQMINDESDSEGTSGRLAPAKARPPKRGSKAGDEQPPRRVRSPRLTSGARKALILEGAMRFFAENGFSDRKSTRLNSSH